MQWLGGLGYICGGIFGLLVLWVVFRIVRAFIRYRLSPVRRWRERVFRLSADANRCIEQERRELTRHGLAEAAGEKGLYDAAFAQFLASFSVEQLDAYPGIGPATISKLRDAGFAHLAHLAGASLEVPGVTGKRLDDVKSGVRDLMRQARSRFDAGGCPEARALQRQLEAARASATEEGYRALARLQAAEEVLTELKPFAEAAAHVTFTEYILVFSRLEQLPVVFHELLPELETRLQAADQEACKRYGARNGQAAQPGQAENTPPQPEGAPPRRDLFRESLHAKASPPVAGIPVSLGNQSCLPETPGKRDSLPEAPGKQECLFHETGKVATRQELLALLEIDAVAPLSADLIRRQYNLLLERYTPEKFEAAGLEFVALARTKRETLLTAATVLLEEFGQNVEMPVPSSAAPQELRHNPDLDAMFG